MKNVCNKWWQVNYSHVVKVVNEKQHWMKMSETSGQRLKMEKFKRHKNSMSFVQMSVCLSVLLICGTSAVEGKQSKW